MSSSPGWPAPGGSINLRSAAVSLNLLRTLKSVYTKYVCSQSSSCLSVCEVLVRNPKMPTDLGVSDSRALV